MYMNVVQRIAKNTLALFIAQFVVTILSMLLSIFIARLLGSSVFGEYSFILAFTAFFVIFSDLGYNLLLIRTVARDKTQANRYAGNILGLRAVLSLIIFISIVITINILNYPLHIKGIIYLFGIYSILGSLSGVFKVTFRAFERMEYESGITILSNILRVTLGLIVLFLGYGLLELVLVFLFSGIIDLLLCLWVTEKKIVKVKLSFDINFIKNTIKISLPLGMLSIFGLIFVRIDTIMLSIMDSFDVVGWYNAAYYLVLGFKPIPYLFINALVPVMSIYYINSKKSLNLMYEKAFKYLFILGLPLAIGLTLLADKFIILFYGQQYFNSIIALQILAWDVLLIFSYSALGGLLISIDRQNAMAGLLGLTALINVILNLILIPSYSYIGAAAATIITEVILLILYAVYISKTYYKLPFHKIVIRPIMAGCIMSLFLYCFNFINLFLLIIFSAIIYFMVLYLVKGLSLEDMDIIKKALKPRKDRNKK